MDEIFGPPIDLMNSDSATMGGFNFNDAISSAGSLLGNLANVWGSVEVAKVKANQPTYYRAPNGQIYREGVPTYQSSTGAINPMLLLLIAGVAIFALKD